MNSTIWFFYQALRKPSPTFPGEKRYSYILLPKFPPKSALHFAKKKYEQGSREDCANPSSSGFGLPCGCMPCVCRRMGEPFDPTGYLKPQG